ncbi:MAG: hypothetical protein ACI90V_007506, partial [Bacillariaceae sp.]
LKYFTRRDTVLLFPIKNVRLLRSTTCGSGIWI